MKTHDELLIETRRVEALSRRYAAGNWLVELDGKTPVSRVLMTFPDSRLRVEPLPLVAEEVSFVTVRRWMAVSRPEGRLEFRLLESATDPADVLGREMEPFCVMASDAAFDVVKEGYELVEAERLGEALAPLAERVHREEFVRGIEPALIEAIENIVHAEDLTPAERLRAKADIVEFLEGRLEPSEFIAAAVARHGRRETQCERLVERHGERMLMDEP